MKRSVDILISVIALLLLSPLLVVVALCISLDSRGPVLFLQERVGIGGRPFRIYKFRSMRADASSDGRFRTEVGDPRITRVGRIIRRTSIDELPQLINVLLGDMSIVGPRPDVPAQKADYAEQDWQRRHSVRPGITGLAQVSGRSTMTPEQRLALDLEYVDNHSLGTDLRIMVMTVTRLFARDTN